MFKRRSFSSWSLCAPCAWSACLAVWAAGCPTGPVEPGPSPQPGVLRINEVNCRANPSEWVELINAGDLPIETAGYEVADGPAASGVVVPTLTLQAGELLVVRGAIGISCGEDSAILRAATGVVDEAPPASALPDAATWGRTPDGDGPFGAVFPTPQKSNLAFVDERGSLFELGADGFVPRIDLFVDAAVEQSLRDQGKGAGYVPALFSYDDGESVSPAQRVDIRIKGSITLRPWDGKPGLKINFARHDGRGAKDFRGLRKLTVNNLTYDPSALRERLAFDVMRDAGVNSPHVGWARVFVNGTPKGVYSVMETYDRQFFADKMPMTRALYESDGATGAGSLGGFDVDEGEDDADFDPLFALAARLDGLPADSTNVVAELPEVDWRQVAKVTALEDLLSHFDGHRGACHNFFLHFDGPYPVKPGDGQTQGKVTLYPWSVDLTLVTANGIDQPPLGSCGKLATLCDQDAQCRTWFERERDNAAQQALRTDWLARMLPIANALAPFIDPLGEPYVGNEFWPSAGPPDLPAATTAAVDMLKRRATAVRCGTGVRRGDAPLADFDASCGGFTDGPGDGGGGPRR